MQAMILAAGLGSRLGDLGKKSPKCLLPIAGVPMLDRVVGNLKLAGVNSLIINLHHLADQVQAHVRRRESYGIEVLFSDEEEKLLGTGGGLLKARELFHEDAPFIVHNADVYTDLDLSLIVKAHQHNQPLATLAVIKRESSRPLVFDDSNRLVGWEVLSSASAKYISGVAVGPHLSRYGFSGIAVLSSRIFHYLENRGLEFSVIDTYLDAAEEGEAVCAYDMSAAEWVDVGTPERIAELEVRLAR